MRLALALLLLLLPATGQTQTWALPDGQAYVETTGPVKVRLGGPTLRYDHDVLGGMPRWSTLSVAAPGGSSSVSLPENLVFEDTRPRLWDVTGDGTPEIVVVESSLTKGARLAVWSFQGARLERLAETAYFGRPQRWLAPLAVGDFDGDGRPEIAYVDRPHLARELVFLRFENGNLRELARLGGVTNHRIGDSYISGGARNCGKGSEAILVDSDWSRIIAVTLRGTRPEPRILGSYQSPASLQAALACKF
tara:strand:+ start:13916 stop:14665 length:750 start_codon:yes stop_codon:yes gene_type:complete